MKPYPLFLFKSKTFNHLHNYAVVLGLFKTEKGKVSFSIVPTLTILFARCKEGPAGRAAVAQHLRPHLHHRLHLLTHRLQDCQEKVIFPPTDLLWLKYSFWRGQYFIGRSSSHGILVSYHSSKVESSANGKSPANDCFQHHQTSFHPPPQTWYSQVWRTVQLEVLPLSSLSLLLLLSPRD